jgi:CubicO group peptidase (beta-lactamase class C family)
VYEITPLSHVQVTHEGDSLWAQGTGQKKLPIEQKSPSVFVYKDTPGQITFLAGATGSIIGLILRQGGTDWAAPKVSVTEAAQNELRARRRIATQLPDRGTEEALRRYLDCLRVGRDACRVRDATLSAFDRLYPQTREAARQLGEVSRIELKGISRGSGLSIYEVRSAHGLSQWYLGTSARGKVTSALYRPLPAPPTQSLDRSTFLSQVQEYFAEASRAERFSGVVLVAEDDKILFQAAYGLADRERGIPNEIDTRFCIASMDKMFTAVATMQLIEAGRIHLNDPVEHFLPDYPNAQFAHEATVQQLLMHTAGAGDIFDPAYAQPLREVRELADYVRIFGSRPESFHPGSNWAYSNYGYVLLGRIIETTADSRYEDVIQKQVFARASMTNTGAQSKPEDSGKVALRYTRVAGHWQLVTDPATARRSPAGGSYSTAADLLHFANTLRAHGLVSPSGTRLLTTGRIGTGTGRYGLGFQEQSIGDVRYVGHAGDAPGISAELRMIEGSPYTLIVLSNFDPPAAPAAADFVTVRLVGAPR